MISVYFQGKPFTIIVVQVNAPTSNAEETEVEWCYEDLWDLLELTPKRDVIFIIGDLGDLNAKVGSQEIPGIAGNLGHGVQNEAGQRLIEFCDENTLVIAHTHLQQHKWWLYTWTSPDGQTEIRKIDYIFCSQRWKSSIESEKKKQDWELTVAQIMSI